MKRAFLIFFVFIAASAFASGIGFHGSVRNSVYSYESDETHTRMYQYARFSAVSPCTKFTFQTSLRALTDAQESLTSEERFKLYSLRLNGKGLFNKKFDFSVGRLFLHPGTVLGALDGLNAKYTFSKHYSLQVYGGVESHFKRSLKVYETKDSQTVGGLFQISRYFASKLQFLYLRKANENEIFWHLTGLNFDTALLPKTILRAQAHYDLEQSRVHRLLLSARNTWSSTFMTTLEYKQQFPQVYANSYFTIFTPEAYQRVRLGVAYEFIKNYNIQAQYQVVAFEDDNANQFYLTVGNNWGNLGMVYENGYAGDQLGLMFDVFYEVIPNLVASLYVDYSKYRVEEVYEFDNQLANAARLSYRLGRHWTFDVEYQWLTNRYKDSDSRFLNHISFVW
jgi:hypothetical protein